MRYEPMSGILRLDRHLARLENSAKTLGFPLDVVLAQQKLDAVTQGNQPLRLRLTLDPDGVVELTSGIYTPLPPQTVWRVAVAKTKLRHDDPLLRHKTTQRALYVAAREEFSRDEVDEVILLNELDQLCEGTITSLFLDMGNGACTTPALSCGLLDGVLRRELLDNCVMREAVLTIDDLNNAKNILVGNSLRGMIRAQLISVMPQ